MNPVTILYLGKKMWGDAFQAVVESMNWYVYTPETMRDALGIYAMLFPDVVVLDAAADSKLAESTYFHLKSVDCGPVMVLTSGFTPEWVEARDCALPRTSGIDTIIAAVTQLAQGTYQPSQLVDTVPRPFPPRRDGSKGRLSPAQLAVERGAGSEEGSLAHYGQSGSSTRS